MISLVILGIFSIIRIPRELTPEIRIPIVGVTTVYPGASSYDVEQLVTEKIEKQLSRSLKKVESLKSTSAENVSTIIITFESNVNIDEAVTKVRDEVNKIKNDLPKEANDSLVQEFSFNDIPVFVVSLSSNRAFTELSNTVDDVKEMFLEVSGVSKVEVDGIPERQVNIILDKNKLTQYGINSSFVIGKISQDNFSIPGGSIVQGNTEYNFRIDSKLTEAKDLENIILKTLGQGNNLYLKDVAKIEDGLAPYTSLSRLSIGGNSMEQAITFSVYKQVDGDVDTVTELTRKKLEDVKTKYEGTDFITLIDFGKDIKDSIRELSVSAIETIILVIIILTLGLGFKASVIAGLTVPMSFLMTFIGLDQTGGTLNFISLFALIFSVGMLVDSSVVIIEGIATHKASGEDNEKAIKNTLKEYASPVFMGTLTTLAIFIPLALMDGTVGEFIKAIPVTIIFVLSSSLIFALIFLPLISFWIKTTQTKNPFMQKIETKRDGYINKLNNWYSNLLRKLISDKKRSKRLIASTVISLFVLLVLFGTGVIKSEFFPADDFSQLNVTVKMPKGSTIGDTSEAIKPAEEYLIKQKDVSSFVSRIYKDSAEITVILKDKKYGEKNLKKTRDYFKEINNKADFFVSQPSEGVSTGAPINIKLTGSDYNKTIETSKIIKEKLSEIKGTIDVDSSVSESRIDIVINIDKEKTAEAGIEPIALAGLIRNSIYGAEATTIRKGDDDISIFVKTALNNDYNKSEETNHISWDQIRALPVETIKGTSPLGVFIKEDIVGNNPVIEREDEKRVITVSSYLEGGVSLSEVTSKFSKIMAKTELPSSVSWSFGGDVEENSKAQNKLLGALGFGLILIVGVLVLQFNSFKKMLLIASVIPLGLIGVLLTSLIANEPISFISMFGFVALAGIVVNNSIILIDVFGNLEEGTLSKEDVVVEGSKRRLRPILLTSATTIIGMVPLLFSSPMWRPLAVSIAGGLTFATIITLILVPVLYYRKSNKNKDKTL